MAAEKKETILALIGGGKPKGPTVAGEGDGDGDETPGMDENSPMDKGVDDDGEEQVAADEVMEAFEKKDSAMLKDALTSFVKICMTKY